MKKPTHFLLCIFYVQLGYDIDGRELNDVFWRFKSVAEMKKVITDDDLIALVSVEVFQPTVVWKFGDVQAPVKLLEYSMSTVTAGIDAIVSTRVVISAEDDHMTTHASGHPRQHAGIPTSVSIITFCILLSKHFNSFIDH
ncbi:putative 2-isopropylmalate synthase [Helianthus annuus]|nr:putative 2-isopropylmalate synthase [Helianthus annuus]